MWRLALIFTALLAASASAQAPAITPAGDPSVTSDTIYKLAVNPADYPDQATVWLLDDGVLRYDEQGRETRTYRKVIQVLKQAAVEQMSEQSFAYSAGHERQTINWIKVVKPNGEVISAGPSHVQESDMPAAMGDPVYSDTKIKRVSLTGLAPGTILDYSVTTEELKPFLPGDFYNSWLVNPEISIRRSRYVVDVPANLDLRIRERNLTFPRQVKTVGNRRVYTWATADVPRIKGEQFASDSNGVRTTIEIGSPTTWNRIAAWYADNAKDRYSITPAVAAKLAEVVKGAATRDDSIRAIHRWIAQDIRYVSISLGMGGYQPRTPEAVVQTGYGDCKDKATIFIAALAKMGVVAYPVLLNSRGGVRRELPTIEQLDHVIAAIKKGSGYQFVDLTAGLTPFGQLPYGEQGEFGLVVRPDRTSEEVTLPEDPESRNATTMRIVGTLSENGIFDGSYQEEDSGVGQYFLREVLENPLDSAARANIPRSIAGRFFRGADADSLQAFNGKDLSAPARISFQIHNAKAAEALGTSEVFTIPLGGMEEFSSLATELEKEPKRRFPIDARRLIGLGIQTTEFRITLPAGWKAKLPPSVTANSAFGSYRSEYVQDGRVMRITRVFTDSKAVLPPERMPELIVWLRQIGKDDAKLVLLEKPASTK
jgi:transglutaminase-like putative cysteine protease